MFFRPILTATMLVACAARARAAEAPPPTSAATQVSPRYSGQPLLRVFTERDTGGSPRNHAVAIHPSGVVYVANDVGLREFDGVTWRVVPGTEGRYIFKVAIDPAGRVFYSGPNHFGRLRISETGALVAEPLQKRLPAEDQDIGEIWDIVPAGGGATFLSESRGLALRVETDGSVQVLRLGGRGFSLWEWRGAVYAVSPQTTFRLEGTSAVPDPAAFAPIQALLGRSTTGVWPRPAGGAWVVTRRGELRLWDNGAVATLPDDIVRLLGSDQVACGLPLADGTLALGTRAHGLLLVDATGRVLANYREDNGLGVGGGFIEGLALDDDSGLWVAHDGGVTRVAVGNPGALHAAANGLRGRQVAALAIHRGRLHVATSQAVFVREPVTGRFTAIAGSRPGTQSLLSTEEGLIVAGQQIALVRDDGSIVPVDTTSMNVRSALRLPRDPDRIVASTSVGLRLYRRAGGEWRLERAMPELRDQLGQLTMDAAGWLWAVRDSRQLIRIDWRNGPRADAPVQTLGAAQGLRNFEEELTNLRLVLMNGNVTLAATRLLLRHDAASDHFVPETRIAGLVAAEVTPTLFALDESTFWFSRSQFPRGAGVVRATGPEAWTFAAEPWSGVEGVSPRAVVLDAANRTVWIGGAQLASYDLSLTRPERPPPAARLRRLTDVQQKDIWVEGAPSAPLVLRPEQNALQFNVTAAYFQPNAAGQVQIEFRTRLTGFDPDWSAWGRNTQVTYTNLPPGSYVFQAQARGEEAPGAISTRAFTLLPPWWRTWWFIGLAGMTGVGSVAGITRWFANRALKRRVQLLEAQSAVEHERLRLARDLHDEVGSGLGRVILFAGEADRNAGDPVKQRAALDRVRGAAQELVQHAREIVWAVSPQHDTLASVVERLSDYVEETFRAAGIACVVDIPPPGEIPPGSLGSEARHSLFLAVKEAVHNGVKYSEAKTAELRLAFVGDDFVIMLRDHGRGFAAGERRGSGHGTRNIVARAEALGGRAEIVSAPGQGTTVTLRVPLRKPEV